MDPRFPPDLSSDDPNPYAPPRTHESPRASVAIGVVPFDLGCILRATWMLYKERFGACLAVCWTAMVLAWGSQFLQNRLREELVRQAGGPFEAFLFSFSLFFIVYVFNGWISIGQNLALLEIARRRPGAFDQLFRGGRFLLTSLLAGVLLLVAIIAAALVGLMVIPIGVAVLGRGGPGMILVVAAGAAIACATATYL